MKLTKQPKNQVWSHVKQTLSSKFTWTIDDYFWTHFGSGYWDDFTYRIQKQLRQLK